MNDTINMVPAIVDEEVGKLSREIEKFRELSDNYMKTNQKLEGWNSPNKLILEQKIRNAKPAFDEALEVITSYKDVAGKSVAVVSEAERLISEKFMA